MNRRLIVGVVGTITVLSAGCAGNGQDAIRTGDPVTTIAASTTTSTTTAPTTPHTWPATPSTTSTTTTTTTTEAAPVVTAAGVEVPIPAVAALPAPEAASGGFASLASHVGNIQIPRVGLNAPMWKASDDFNEAAVDTALNNGPSIWGSPTMPGQQGNLVIGGHRVSKGAWFRNIDQLAEGDPIVVAGPDGIAHTYLVTTVEIVPPDARWILDATDSATITLFACHPPGSVRQRIIVKGELQV